jgi:hypothetical protein
MPMFYGMLKQYVVYFLEQLYGFLFGKAKFGWL